MFDFCTKFILSSKYGAIAIVRQSVSVQCSMLYMWVREGVGMEMRCPMVIVASSLRSSDSNTVSLQINASMECRHLRSYGEWVNEVISSLVSLR